ncbi:hypothetical protein AVEN_89337-1 [Araneus ventricosus]|uniref:Uncharacterized protein n=1 Tax=Araneus ventricosus TaxID=182803 RepID=A0A4Y2MZB3_ARAVE|nr:hypothetical protein AVEN_89337-1 [Araneus ventricosus]
MRIKVCVISWHSFQHTRFVEFGRLRPEPVLDVYLGLIITCKLLAGKKFLDEKTNGSRVELGPDYKEGGRIVPSEMNQAASSLRVRYAVARCHARTQYQKSADQAFCSVSCAVTFLMSHSKL